MAKVLDLPKLSPTMEEGQIAKWHKQEGDAVGVDDLLAEVETDKATMEYRSFDKGTLLKILAPAGAVVRLGEPVAILGAPGEDVSALVGGGGDAQASGGKQPEIGAKQPETGGKQPETGGKQPETGGKESNIGGKESHVGGKESETGGKQPEIGGKQPEIGGKDSNIGGKDSNIGGKQPEIGGKQPETGGKESQVGGDGLKAAVEASIGPTGRVKASPYVRKMARDQGFDLASVAGSGPGGRIIARDLADVKPAAASAEAASPAAASPAAGASGRVSAGAAGAGGVALAGPAGALAEPEARPLSMMRKAIARRLTESKQTVPHFYLTIDVDADPLHALREQLNADLLVARGEGAPKLSLNDLLVKACAIALVRVPECNAQFSGDAILIHRRVDISVAVSVAEGLMTPVVRNADSKGLLAISAEVRELAARAKSKKLRLDEMQNGTFSISNLGMFGIDAFAAVINPPEGAILAVGQVRREPVVKGDAVVPGRKLAMTLSCDHRVIDGAVGATFLRALRQLVEHPTQILVQ